MAKHKIDDEELGIESYHVKRQQAVERAMEKARRAISDTWKELSQHDLEVLSWTLGEIWAFSGRSRWDSIVFSGMTLPAVVKIIQIGDQVKHREKDSQLGFEEVSAILASLK